MGCDEEALAVSVLLELKQIEQSSSESKVPTFLTVTPAEIFSFPSDVAGMISHKNDSLKERKQQNSSVKRGRQKDCIVGSKCHGASKKSRSNFDNTTHHSDQKLCQISPANSPVSVTSNLPAISSTPNLPMPSLPLTNILPSTFDPLVKQVEVLSNPSVPVAKFDASFRPRAEVTSAVPCVPSADVSLRLLQQLFSLVNLLSPQELASALLVAELEKLKAKAVAQQQAELGNCLASLPILMPLLQQQVPTIGKPTSATPPPKFDLSENHAAMTLLASLLLQTCTNTLS